MSIIIPANSAVSGGFDVANSCMFNSPDSASMQKTAGTPTDNNKWTFSAWVKRSKLGTLQEIFYGEANSTNYCTIRFNDTSDTLTFKNRPGSTTSTLTTTQVFRDPNAWYHLVVVLDTSNGTAADRDIIYINGVRETNFSTETHSGSGDVCFINSNGNPIKISKGNSASFFDGYMAEAYFIDGQALAASDFGEFDEDSGIWKPIDASGLTFGNNGFYLDFQDSANLGNDANGGTDLTESNLAATDQGIDTCTNNFAVNNKLSNITSRWTMTNGNNTIQHANSGAWTAMISSIAPSVGKYYMETKITGGASRTMFGVMSADTNIMGYETNLTTICLYYNLSGGEFQESGSTTSGNNYGTFADNDTAGIAVDCANNKIAIYKNGSALVTNHTIPATVTGPIGFGFTSDSNSTVYQCNYGSPYYTISSGNADANGYGNFEYAVPSGYFALCTKNLAEYG